MLLTNNIQKKLTWWGANLVGFSNVDEYLPKNLKELKYAITIGVRLSDFIVNEISDKPTYTYFHHYRSINALIDHITLRGSLYIMDKGYNAISVPASQTVKDVEDKYSGIFPHKTAAALAGLGWIGKSALFISSKYGPRVRLGTILTDAPINISNERILEGNCDSCNICVNSCPAKAITGNSWYLGCDRSHLFDAAACSKHMKDCYNHIGRGSVCGICMKVCGYRYS